MRWLDRIAASILAKQVGVDAGTLVSMINGGSRGVGRRKFSAKNVLAAYDTSPWFRAVVERVSFAAAVVPWRLFAVKPAQGSRAWKQKRSYIKHNALASASSPDIRDKIAKQLDANGQLEEIDEHPLFDLMNEPNPVLTGIDMRLITFASLLVVGEIGWAISRGEKLGEPTEIWPVPSHWITRRPGNGYAFYDVQVAGSVRHFTVDEFVLFRNPTLTNPYAGGAGTGSTLADELETDEYISKFQATTFVNGGKPDLIFVAKPDKEGAMVAASELKKSKDQFENQYRGVNRGSQSFWHRGDIDVTELNPSSMVDLALTEQRTWIKDLVRQVIGAPPEVMGDLENSNRATITEALAILAIITTVPQVERMRAQLQLQLMPMFDERLALGYWSPVPDDREFKLKAMQAAPWAATVGDWRKIQELEDRGEADEVHMTPVNLIPVPAPKSKAAAAQRQLEGSTPKALGARTKATPADVDAWLNALQPETLTAEVAPLWSDEFKEWGEKTTADLGIDPAAFSMVNPFVSEHLLDFSTNRIADINDTTLKHMRETLLEGVREGEDIRRLSARTREVFDLADRHRSIVIARTEVIRSSNASTFTAYDQSGIVEFIQWVAAFVNTRDTHAELNGEQVRLGESFVSVSGATAQHPGGFGVAAEDIQCMCTITAVIGEPKSLDVLGALWKIFQSERAPWERKAERAFRRGFAQQEKDLLEAMSA